MVEVAGLCVSPHLLDGALRSTLQPYSQWCLQPHLLLLLSGPCPHPLTVSVDRPCYLHIAQLRVSSCKAGQVWSTRGTVPPALALGSFHSGWASCQGSVILPTPYPGRVCSLPPKDVRFKPRVGSLAPARVILLAPCLFSGTEPDWLAASSSGRRSPGHPGLLFISSHPLWCCDGMPWLLGIVLGHPLVGLPCPLLIFAAASWELRNGPAASSLAGLPNSESRGENLYRFPGGNYSRRKLLSWLVHTLQGSGV